MPDNKHLTDVADKGWDDLQDADPEIVKELAGERGLDRRRAHDALCAGILAFEGRDDEIPDEDAEEHLDVIEEALAAGEGTETADAPVEDDREIEESEPEDDDHNDKTLDNAVEPNKTVSEDASFIIDASALQDWLDYPDTLVDESKVHIEPDGLRIRAVDPANVGMIDTALYDTAFESYPTVREEGLIGVNLERLIDVVGMANAGDLIEIEYVAERGNLIVRHTGQEYTLALIDPDSIRSEPDIPNLDLPARVEFVEAESLRRFVTGADMVSDHIALGVDADEAVFYAEAEGDTDDWYGEYEDGEEVDIHKLGHARSLYSLDYLKDIRKPLQKDRPAVIDLGEEFPFDLRQTIYGDEDAEVGEVQYLLAPRIQSD